MAGLTDPDIKRKMLTSPDAETKKFAGVFKIAEREERALLYARQLLLRCRLQTLLRRLHRSTRSTRAHVHAMFAMVTSVRLLQLQPAVPAAAPTPRTRQRRLVRGNHYCASDTRLTLIWRITAPIKVPSAGTATRLDIWNMRTYLRRRPTAKLEYTIWTNN